MTLIVSIGLFLYLTGHLSILAALSFKIAVSHYSLWKKDHAKASVAAHRMTTCLQVMGGSMVCMYLFLLGLLRFFPEELHKVPSTKELIVAALGCAAAAVILPLWGRSIERRCQLAAEGKTPPEQQ
jgi:hypothetical protein